MASLLVLIIIFTLFSFIPLVICGIMIGRKTDTHLSSMWLDKDKE